jgi:hypothetical protein
MNGRGHGLFKILHLGLTWCFALDSSTSLVIVTFDSSTPLTQQEVRQFFFFNYIMPTYLRLGFSHFF